MTDINCEKICVAYMALVDGEESMLRAEEIETHLFNCERCREEIEQLGAINQLLSLEKRLKPETNLWPQLNESIEARTGNVQPFGWRVLLLFAVPLFGYKLLMLVFHAPPSLWSKLVTVILVITVFVYLRANPFRINCELTLEGEMTS
jgi:predicted anti-sigma-YlaC factor YlaD